MRLDTYLSGFAPLYDPEGDAKPIWVTDGDETLIATAPAALLI